MLLRLKIGFLMNWNYQGQCLMIWSVPLLVRVHLIYLSFQFGHFCKRLLALRSPKSVALSSASSTTRFWASSAFVDLFLIVGALAAALSAEATDAVSSHSLEMYYKLTINNILIHPLQMTRGVDRKTPATPGPYLGSENAAANKAQGGCQFREIPGVICTIIS